jgi:hypothetical protein
MSPNASIEHNKSQPINCPARRQQKRRGKVFNVKGNLTLSTTHLSTLSKPTHYDIEGTLGMQRMILQGLARKENVANGLSECESRSTSQADLNHLKKEACMVLQDTWDRSGRK